MDHPATGQDHHIPRPWHHSLNAFAWAGTAIYALCLLAAAVNTSDHPTIFFRLSVAVPVAIIVSTAMSWLAWWLGRGRGNLTSLTFAATLTCFGMAEWSRSSHRQDVQDQIQTLRDRRHDRIDQLERMFAEGKTHEAAGAHLAEDLATWDKVAQRTPGREGRIFAAIADTLRDLELPLKRYNLALTAFIEAGMIQTTGITTPADIEARLQLLDRVILASEALTQTFAGQEQGIQNRLISLNLSAAHTRQLVAQWRAGAHPELAVALRANDHDVATHYRDILLLLHQSFSHWKTGPNGTPIFGNRKSQRIYDAHMASLFATLERQDQLQQQLLEHLQR